MNTKKQTVRCGVLDAPKMKRIVSLLLSITMLLTLIAGVNLSSYADDSSDWDYYCEWDDGNVELSSYNGTEEIVNVPTEIDGYTVKSIGYYTFSGCDNLKIINIPKSIESIDDFAFNGCPNLTAINVASENERYYSEDGVLYDGNYLCKYPEGRSNSEYKIKYGTYGICQDAFSFCQLSSIYIPETVVDICNNPFRICENLTSIQVDSKNQGLKTMDGILYSYDNELLICCPMGLYIETYKVPDGVKYIGASAFEWSHFLTKIELPKTLKIIGRSAFADCQSLENVVLPEEMEGIYICAFAECYNLKSITIPSSLEFIHEFAFDCCESLTDIYYAGSKEDWNKISIYDGNGYLKNANIHYKFKPVANNKFSDIQNSEYVPYSDYVMYTSVYNKFIAGTNPPYYTEFSPRTAITRAMFVAILYRMAGNPYDGANPYTSNPFSDINTNAYYYNAACWALDEGITNQTTFKPNNNVTREQTARFLFAYAESKGLLGDEAYKNVNLGKYPDYNGVHSWAVEPLQWANYNDMITGTQQGYINPQGATQRIHATRILYGFGKVCNIGNFE